MLKLKRQDVIDWTVGMATLEVCDAIHRDLDLGENSLVREYLDWQSGKTWGTTPRLIKEDFEQMSEQDWAAFDTLSDINFTEISHLPPVATAKTTFMSTIVSAGVAKLRDRFHALIPWSIFHQSQVNWKLATIIVGIIIVVYQKDACVAAIADTIGLEASTKIGSAMASERLNFPPFDVDSSGFADDRSSEINATVLEFRNSKRGYVKR